MSFFESFWSGIWSRIRPFICGKKKVEIGGRTYVVLEHIADGGFSRIDLVEDVRSKRTYALKTIICHSTEDQIAASREIEYHKQLDHPFVLRLEGSAILGRADIIHNQTSQVLLLLPYYSKGTLHDDLNKRSLTSDYLPQRALLTLFRQICEGLNVMHSLTPNPLAHRDIKPHNILMTRDNTPVIMDLGSTTPARVKISNHSEAQHLQDIAAERSSMPYRSPELFQVNSKCDIDERTDVWSLGCLLFALCFFKSPYDSVFERGDSVALAVQSANIVIPENSPYSDDIHDLIKWMLTTDISLRPFIQQVMSRLDELINPSSS